MAIMTVLFLLAGDKAERDELGSATLAIMTVFLLAGERDEFGSATLAIMGVFLFGR